MPFFGCGNDPSRRLKRSNVRAILDPHQRAALFCPDVSQSPTHLRSVEKGGIHMIAEPITLRLMRSIASFSCMNNRGPGARGSLSCYS